MRQFIAFLPTNRKPIRLQKPKIEATMKYAPRANKYRPVSRFSRSSSDKLLTFQPAQILPAWVMKTVAHAKCERPKMEFQILYLLTYGSAFSMYSSRLALWNFITCTTLLMYMMLVHTEVMNSIIRIV